ncbi:MAG: cation:proton antiporter [Flavobacteriales bacterium]|nr:cation:proton antiporter [Flavobacteriales bacterium]
MQIPLLKEIVLILGLSVAMILLFKRLKLPVLLGFLATGAVFGPHALGFVSATHEVELLAEVGVIFLLFVIGIEFSLKSLATLGRTALVGGTVQVAGTVGATALVAHFFGLGWPSAIFLGFLFALSSTAIVLKLLQEQGAISASHGRVSSAMLIYQDIIVVPMILLTPMLAGHSEDPAGDLYAMLGKMIVLLVLVFVAARFAVPRLLDAVVRTQSRELFITTIVVLCFATAWLTSSIGLSLALGAFFAGLIISESEHRYQATGNILPFHEVFISFFFVSIGMLLDLAFLWEHLFTVLFFTLLTLLGKTVITALAALVLRYPLRTALLAGFALCQVGEFAFILSATGLEHKVLSREHYQLFLCVSVMTMGLAPFIILRSNKWVSLLLRSLVPARIRHRLDAMNSVRQETPAEKKKLTDHIVIVGFGLNGRNVAQTARLAGIGHVVIEGDPDLAEQARAEDIEVISGDASNEHVLEEAATARARVVVVAIADPAATRRVVARVRRLSDAPHIIVRARFVAEIEELRALGANEVVPEEFETSIEIFARTLRHYLVPEDEVEELVTRVRGSHYKALRSMTKAGEHAGMAVHASDQELAALPVRFGKNRTVGQRLMDTDVKGRFGVSVLAINRGDRVITGIDGTTRMLSDDVLYVLGPPEGIAHLDRMLRE